MPGRAELDAPVEAASVPYRWGMGVGGGLTILGRAISLIGIVNPRRAAEPSALRVARPSAVQVARPEGRREAQAVLTGAAGSRR